MELFLRLLKLYGAALIGYGFIYFVVIRLTYTRNFKKLAFRSFITGFVLSIITFGAILFDAIKNKSFIVNYNLTEPYFVFLNTIVLMTVIISTVFLIMGCRRNQRLMIKKPKVEKAKPTINDYKDNIIIVFMHNGNFLLKKIEEEYSTYKERMNRIHFHDEAVNKIIGDFEIRESSQHFEVNYENVGEVIVKGKIDDKYYCYKIELDEIPKALSNYVEVSPFDLFECKLSELDKQVLYHVVLKEKFKIEM